VFHKPKRGICFELNGASWCAKFPPGAGLVARWKPLQVIGSWFPQHVDATLGDLPIYRTDHCFNPVTLRKIYNKPNMFVSDLPETYLILYANAALTLSNRVHACAASLAYGNRAMLFSSTPRARLLERVGAHKVKQHPVAIDLVQLNEEKSRLMSFVRSLDL
jgi:hypothetical protein